MEIKFTPIDLQVNNVKKNTQTQEWNIDVIKLL